jgi:hypothetical protein
LPFAIVSAFNANTKAFGIVAPRRLSMIAFGIATTSALTVRVHCCIRAGSAVVAGAVSALTDSISVPGDTVAGLVVSFATGTITSGAGFTTGALNSATGLSVAPAGV